ncbi:hypothetical protein K8S19_06995 [bacterium]|nr:hypothetical protein [bacterium]
MRPVIHVSASLTVGGLLGWLTGSWQAAVFSILGGILIDTDHLVDYWLVRRQWRSVKDFFEFWRSFHEKKIYLIFHVGEGVVLLGLAAGWGFFPAITGGLAIGIFHHLILDQWGNRARWPCYFLIGRALNRFETRKLFYSLEKR